MIKLEKIELVINNNKKDVYGEVFTHIELIADILKSIDKRVWQDKNTNFYDPTCGNGYFLFFVYDILMGNGINYDGYSDIDGLKYIIKDDKQREKHIIENMIYGNDIQQDNIDFCNNMFKSDIYKTNFICHDYMTFDISVFNKPIKNIIGNPPFQAVMNETGKRKAKNHNLWRPMTEKAFNEIEDGGTISFVCPSSWMSLSNSNKNMFRLFKENDVIKINIGECDKYFKGVGNNFSFFTIKKKPKTDNTNTHVICKYKNKIYKSEIKIDIDCLPLLITDSSINILKKVVFSDNEKYKIKYDSYLHAYTKRDIMSDKKDDIHKYRLYHTNNIIKWSQKPHLNQDKWKIMIPRSTYYEKLFINKGDGTTQSMGYLICDNEIDCEKNKKILLSKLYIYIMKITRWGNWTSQDILYRLPKLDINKKWTDQDIYDYFNLTKKEKEEIEIIVNK